MATGLVRPVRNFRSGGRIRVRHESAEDVVISLDFSREPQDNVKEILKNVVMQRGVSSSRKTAYLNSFVKLIRKVGYHGDLGIPIPDIMMCLEAGLMNEAKQVRTASLRVLRYLLPYPETLECFVNLHLDFLVVRCLDISLDNEIERIHAIKLIRQIIKTSPQLFPKSLLYALIAIGNDGTVERDRMVRVSLETLCELAITNIDLVAKCGGIQTLTWNILDSHQYPRLNEALTSTIIFLLNHPKTRRYIRPQIDLERLLAPFTDSHFRYSIEDTRGEERESRFIASKLAVVTVMQSWPGLIRLCHPEGSGMQSLIGVLYLPNVEIRRYILEVISDVFRLTLPPWTEDFSTAFASVDFCEQKDNWKITEGFVADEGRSILPHISRTRPNLIDHHLAILLSAWFNAGLREALVEVVITSEGALFNRAVLLLAELLNMANRLLPPECLHQHHENLPSLISMASSPDLPKAKRKQAHQAVMCLTRYHKMQKRGMRPHSFFLDQLLQHAGKMSEITSKRWYLRREKLSEYYFRNVSSEELTNNAMRDSLVNSMKPPADWNWGVIAALLRWPDEKFKKLEDQNHLRFVKRLCMFFKPENDQFSKTDFNDPNQRSMCIVGCHLIDFLMLSGTDEADKMITEFLQDLSENLKEVTRLNVPVEENAMFGSKRIYDKLCRFYFVFIGRFTSTKRGCVYLEKSGIIQSLMEMMSPSVNILYVKLAISALNFSSEGSTRPILSKALTATSDGCRVYATKMLRVLMRAGTLGFGQWGIEMLVTQLYDQEKSVAMSALHILDEACDNEDYLKTLIKLRPSLLHLGEKGVLLLSRFVSSVQGFRSLNDANFISSQLEKWHKSFNDQYVDIVEEMLNEALMTYEKTFSGTARRRSIHKGPKKDVFLPAHLYGQLTMHEEGLDLLKKESCIHEYFNCIHNQVLLESKDLKRLKTALWAVGHIGLSVEGLEWLEGQNIIPELIRLAEECGVFSVRGTAVFVLGLVACTRKGTDILCELGWESRCHNRKESFPVLDQEGWVQLPMEEAMLISDRLAAAAILGEHHASFHPSISPPSGLSLIQEESAVLRSTSSPSAASRPGSLPPGQPRPVYSLQTSVTSVRSAREPLMLAPPENMALITPSSLSPDGHRGLPLESKGFVRQGQSLPHRSKSERALMSSKKAAAIKEGDSENAEVRPRAQTGDKSTLPPRPEVTIAQKCGSEPVGVDAITLDMLGEGDAGVTMRQRARAPSTSSRDSIQLVASPVVKLLPSSDEDSAVHSDNNGTGLEQSSSQRTKLLLGGSDADINYGNSSASQKSLTVEIRDHKDHDLDVKPAFNLSAELSPTSVDDGAGSGSGTVSFKVGSFTLGGKESTSSEGSNRSKSRGSSFNTNTTDSTSGVGSFDSNGAFHKHSSSTGLHSSTLSSSSATTSVLTPIPSSSSLSTLVASSTLLPAVSEKEAESVHHSALQRSLFRLTRVPSYKRRSASPAVMANGGYSAGGFTSPRDALGYAALRSIKRQRAHSSETEADTLASLAHTSSGGSGSGITSTLSSSNLDSGLSTRLQRTMSQDSEVSLDNMMWLSMRRNVSGVSLQDQDGPSSPISTLNRAAFKPQSPSNRFVGITLPVDIRMVFEVVEGEDKRTSTALSGLRLDDSPVSKSSGLSLSGHVPPLKLEQSFVHCKDICLLCTGFRQRNLSIHSGKEGEDEETYESLKEEEDRLSQRSHSDAETRKLRGASILGVSSNTPGSHTSSSISDSGVKKLSEDSETGRELIRLEVMRLIVNLGSSVGLKASESGLLNLKQRFPKCFQDICFYSEVCYLLSNYSYRLLARRFIQELFDDLSIDSLLDSACRYLDIEIHPQPMEPIRQDSSDEFHDFSFS